MEIVASAIICLVVVAVGLALLFSKRTSFDSLLQGTKDGVRICRELLPTLIVLMVSVSMLNASGFISFLSELTAPLCEKLGVPAELLPLIFMRPMSGAGSNALLTDLLSKHGADTFIGNAASVLLGSSDTAIYICAVYFSAVSIKKTRHALPAAIASMLFCVFFSLFICRLFLT